MNKSLKSKLTVLVSVIAIFFTAEVIGAAYTPIIVPTPSKPFFDGIYLGVGAGIVGLNADVITNLEGSGDISTDEVFLYESLVIPFSKNVKKEITIDNFNNLVKSKNLGRYGFTANIFAGLGKVINSSQYIGGELFANYFFPELKHYNENNFIGSYNLIEAVYDIVYSSQEFDLPVTNELGNINYTAKTETKLKNKYSYGGDLRFGYLVSPRSMIYVLLGLDYSKFQITTTQKLSSQITRTPSIDTITTKKFSTNKVGYIPGIGMEMALNDNVSIRAQYTHTLYSSFKKKIHQVTENSLPIDNQPINEYLSSYSGTLDYKIDQLLTTKVNPNRGVFSVMLSWYLT